MARTLLLLVGGVGVGGTNKKKRERERERESNKKKRYNRKDNGKEEAAPLTAWQMFHDDSPLFGSFFFVVVVVDRGTVGRSTCPTAVARFPNLGVIYPPCKNPVKPSKTHSNPFKPSQTLSNPVKPSQTQSNPVKLAKTQ